MLGPNNHQKIGEFIDSDVNSLWIDSRSVNVKENLNSLKEESFKIRELYENFKENTICQINKAMGKMTSMMHRQIQQKCKLQEELKNVKESNKMMKDEVIQLRQMIEDFVKSYNEQILCKENEIKELKSKLGSQQQETMRIQTQVCESPLQIIQEVSEGTCSALTSLKNSHPNIVQESPEIEQKIKNLTVENIQSGKKRTKLFLDGFRKNIQESLNLVKEKEVNMNISGSSSVSDLSILGETDKINLPKKNQSPKKMEFLKKHSARLKTQNLDDAQNWESTPFSKNKKRTLSFGNFSSEKKSVRFSPAEKSRISVSKEKIKLTFKIMDQNTLPSNTKKNHKCRSSVHLGGKNHIKKLIKELKISLQSLQIWEGLHHRQVKYEGEKKNGQRWGKGKLLYENGFIYEGSFVQNFRHGIGKISLNGITLYEGEWSLDQVNGQGYIKCLNKFCENCPKIFSEASYCGQLKANKFDGMGTLFLNQNEKIVTKFINGTGVGEFTYYNHSEIQFGVWF